MILLDWVCRRGDETPSIYTNPIAIPIYPLIRYRILLPINILFFVLRMEVLLKVTLKMSLRIHSILFNKIRPDIFVKSWYLDKRITH